MSVKYFISAQWSFLRVCTLSSSSASQMVNGEIKSPHKNNDISLQLEGGFLSNNSHSFLQRNYILLGPETKTRVASTAISFRTPHWDIIQCGDSPFHLSSILGLQNVGNFCPLLTPTAKSHWKFGKKGEISCSVMWFLYLKMIRLLLRTWLMKCWWTGFGKRNEDWIFLKICLKDRTLQPSASKSWPSGEIVMKYVYDDSAIIDCSVLAAVFILI